MSSVSDIETTNIHLADEGYSDLVDFLYDYAGRNRLTVLWFGWYQAEPATKWYERSVEEPSNFKIKLELLTEENGSIFVRSYFDESIARLSIDYGDSKPEWLSVVEGFKREVAGRGWQVKAIEREVDASTVPTSGNLVQTTLERRMTLR